MDILVYIEARGGQIRSTGVEALTVARKIVDKVGGSVAALVVGSISESALQFASKYGPDKILIADDPALAGYSPEGHREAVLAAVQQTNAEVIMMTATSLGKDLGPCVAARLEAAFLPDCTAVDVVDGKIQVTRPVYAGRCLMTLSATGSPVVITTRPKAFTALVRDGSPATRTNLAVNLDGKIKSRLVEIRTGSAEKLDVTEADIIVAGGRGMKGPEHFKLIEDLADTLGAAIGASRAVVDAGWRPHSEQVGQTGKVVSPTLYIACGISGAIQHLAGMRTAKTIVAINKDKEAPIFKTADYGIVGDVFEVLPALNEAIKANT